MNKDPSYYGCKSIPQVGQEIYTKGAAYMSHGEDDCAGGKAKISSVKEGISAGKPTIYIVTEERPGWQSNWQCLEEEQEVLAKEYGEQRAHPEPDNSYESNCWISPGDIVGESYQDPCTGKWVQSTRVADKYEK